MRNATIKCQCNVIRNETVILNLPDSADWRSAGHATAVGPGGFALGFASAAA